MLEGVIVLGHGSRRPEANQEIREIAELVKGIGGGEVHYAACFLQFGEPNLDQVVAEMHQAGIQKITVVPLLLTVGSHIQEDLPALLSEQKKRYPNITFVLSPHLGTDRRIAEIVLDRIKQGCEIER